MLWLGFCALARVAKRRVWAVPSQFWAASRRSGANVLNIASFAGAVSSSLLAVARTTNGNLMSFDH